MDGQETWGKCSDFAIVPMGKNEAAKRKSSLWVRALPYLTWILNWYYAGTKLLYNFLKQRSPLGRGVKMANCQIHPGGSLSSLETWKDPWPQSQSRVLRDQARSVCIVTWSHEVVTIVGPLFKWKAWVVCDYTMTQRDFWLSQIFFLFIY